MLGLGLVVIHTRVHASWLNQVEQYFSILQRTDEYGADPRFRLTPLGGGAYGLSLYRRKRWEPLPFEGTLEELAAAMNHDLAAWADDWA